jgi:Zn-dependent peptidase ImmA (M78 family)
MPKINSDILCWARETAGLTQAEAVERLQLGAVKDKTGVERLEALETGADPTRPMLVKMAKLYRRPLLTFYMSSPPRKGDRGQDFRTLPSDRLVTEDALLDALIRDVQARQSLIRSVMEDEETVEPLPFVGSVRMDDGISAALSSLREITQIDLTAFREQPTPEDAFAFLRSKVEAAGVFVLLIGNLGSHHTKISLETFRGFAIADNIAPFIIINDQDSRTAWSFTLLHELTHICLGQTGISGARVEEEIEKFCNDVAGEFLLPNEETLTIGNATNLEEIGNTVSDFARTRNLSSSMVAYKLFRNGSISKDTWFRLNETFKRWWFEGQSTKKSAAKKKKGGPNYYVVKSHRVGNLLISHVKRMMAGGILTTTKAGKILGVKAKNVGALVDTLASSGARRVG